jgi:hypothetical protein
MIVIFWVSTPFTNQEYRHLEKRTASIFKMTEFVRVVSEVIWWKKNDLSNLYIFLYRITTTSTWSIWVTLKMEAVRSSETSKHLITLRPKNPKNGHRLKN